MIIILMNISASSGDKEIEDFISPAVKGGLLRKGGSIEKISILPLKDTQMNRIQYHALVTIMPDSVADRVIKKLSKKYINGRRVVIREFHIRNWHNDPRINRRDPIQGLKNKRLGDRRHRYLEIKLTKDKDISALFSSEDRFSRKLTDGTF